MFGAGMGALRNMSLGLLLAGWCFSGSPALAEKRVALVIGNSSYDKVARLGNPANDAALVAETLKGAGFDNVDLRRDLKIAPEIDIVEARPLQGLGHQRGIVGRITKPRDLVVAGVP